MLISFSRRTLFYGVSKGAAFPLQHWLHERTAMLPYVYFVCLVWVKLKFVDTFQFWIKSDNTDDEQSRT